MASLKFKPKSKDVWLFDGTNYAEITADTGGIVTIVDATVAVAARKMTLPNIYGGTLPPVEASVGDYIERIGINKYCPVKPQLFLFFYEEDKTKP